MSAGGPKPSQFYVERTPTTRVLQTPATPSNKDSRFAFGQNDPGLGQTNPGDGLALGGIFSLCVSIYPNPGATFSGAGTGACWVYNPFGQLGVGAWTRCTDFDFDLSDASGMPGRTFATIRNASRLGMLINWIWTGVTVSGGIDFLMRIDGFISVGGQGAS